MKLQVNSNRQIPSLGDPRRRCAENESDQRPQSVPRTSLLEVWVGWELGCLPTPPDGQQGT
jgi:hypothetical protein